MKFCPKCGQELLYWSTSLALDDRVVLIESYVCSRCNEVSVQPLDELGMFSKSANVEQNIGTVGDGSTVVGIRL